MSVSIHPQAKEAFKEGLESTLRQWTALELAVLNKWGGDSSADKANEFYEQLLDMFTNKRGNRQLYKDDVILWIENFMELNFCTICEDESPTDLGELLILMWNQCSQGDFTLVTNALAREYARHEVMNQCQGIDQSGDEDLGSDSEDEAVNYENSNDHLNMNMESNNTSSSTAPQTTHIHQNAFVSINTNNNTTSSSSSSSFVSHQHNLPQMIGGLEGGICDCMHGADMSMEATEDESQALEWQQVTRSSTRLKKKYGSNNSSI